MPISFSTQATKNTPYKPFGDTSSGLLGSVGKALNLPSSNNQNTSQNMSYPTQNINTSNMGSPIQQGTNPGVLPKPDTTYTHTTTTNQAGGTTSKPTPNPSVLAQQKALNAQGAGLVEDGIAGPLTQAAIAKYGAGATKTGTSATPSATPIEPPKPVSSANPAEQIQNVGQAGQQTQNEAQTQKAVENAGAQTQWEQDIKNGMAVEEANKRLQDLQNKIAEKYANIESQAIPLEFQQGREQALGRQFSAQELAAQQAVQNALANQGQQFTAAGTQAARQATTAGQAYTGAQTQAQRGLTAQSGILNAGLLTPTTPGQVLVNPLLGQQGGMVGTSGVGSLDIPTIAQQVASGQMSIDQANAALGGNIGLTSALRGEITKINPNFNFAQSSTLSGQQGSITPALNYATLALNHAKDTLNNLKIPGQTSNVGALSDVSNWFSNLSGIGKEATRTKEGALAEARSAIQSVLASVKGGNPTEYRDQSYALLPNNATPADIDAALVNLNTLGTAKQNIYGAPGQSTKTSGSSTGGSIWDF